MGFDHNSSPGGGRDPDFGFAFNNRNFSDRVLRIEIVANPTEANGDEVAAIGDDSYGSEDGSIVLRVKTLHISSPILAAKSPFFYKLFVNCPSEHRHATLIIDSSEEAALMELLNFMYSGTLRVNTASPLVDVLVAADKFEVTSCMRHCCSLLRSLGLTLESALLYLNLPSRILLAEAVQPLMDYVRQFLAARYNDLSKHRDEIMNLPLAGIEAILSSDDLQVVSENAVYDFALKWAQFNYQNAEERRDILSNRLGRFIRFPQMSTKKLKEVLTCDYFYKDFTTKVVLDALFFKADTPHRRRTRPVEDSARFVERAYTFRPIKVVEFELPSQHCMVYLDLKREECADISLSGQIYFYPFLFGGQRFFLSAECSMEHQSFRLFLGVQERSSETFSIVYEFGARSKPSEEYISMTKDKCDFTGEDAGGFQKLLLFSIPWTLFMADHSPYFINGVLYLRAELTVKRGTWSPAALNFATDSL